MAKCKKQHNLLAPYDQLPSDQWVKYEDAYTMIPEILRLDGFGEASRRDNSASLTENRLEKR